MESEPMTHGVDKSKNSLTDLLEIQDIIWYNYYSLVTSAVEALAIIWDEYANGSLEDDVIAHHGSHLYAPRQKADTCQRYELHHQSSIRVDKCCSCICPS
jgi:hypothetical protein